MVKEDRKKSCLPSRRRALAAMGTAPSGARGGGLPAGPSDFGSLFKIGCKIQTLVGRDHKLRRVQPRSSG